MGLNNTEIKQHVDTLRDVAKSASPSEMNEVQLELVLVGLSLLENVLQNLNNLAFAATEQLRRS